MKELKDRGLLMTPANATAIDEGRKGMTRWLVKPQPPSEKYQYTGLVPNSDYHEWLTDPRPGHGLRHCAKAPFAVSQRLYLKEPHYRYGKWVANGKTKTGRQAWKFVPQAMTDGFPHFAYAEDKPAIVNVNTFRRTGWYLRSPLFMPKKFARKWLKVTAVRVEMLQDISDEDAIAEGALFGHDPSGKCNWADGFARACFCKLWDSIYRDDKAKSWDANPWTWPISFKKIERPK